MFVHKRCAAILIELQKEGSVELWSEFQFAPKQPLIKRLKDVLEETVNEKYYLSETAIKGFQAHAERMAERGNGFKFEPTDGNTIASSVTTRAGGRPDDNFILVGHTGTGGQRGRVFSPNGCIAALSATDYKDAQKIIEPKSPDEIATCLQTRYGDRQTDTFIKEPKIFDFTNDFGEGKIREYTEFAPTLRSERFGLATEQNYRIRKLTPRECLRLQDFPDTFKQVVSDSQMYKQTGNSMTVAVVEMIFRQINKAIKGESNKEGLF